MVVDRHHLAAVALRPGDDNAAIRGGGNRRSLGGRNVDAGVENRPAVDRMHAHPER